uniref:Ion_trans domain-containing protein n=1 Tax=Macrostomum lignano TaxID=282301 RepID=A0A1I8FJ67_9PLAT
RTPVQGNAKNFSTIKRVCACWRVLRPLEGPSTGCQKLKRCQLLCRQLVEKRIQHSDCLLPVSIHLLRSLPVQSLFQGKFFYCNDASKKTRSECQGYFFNYETAPNGETSSVSSTRASWRAQCFRYDDVFISLITLFTVTDGEGWNLLGDFIFHYERRRRKARDARAAVEATQSFHYDNIYNSMLTLFTVFHWRRLA